MDARGKVRATRRGRNGRPTRVLIADDHGIFRAALNAHLATRPDIAFVRLAASGTEAIATRLSSNLTSESVALDIRGNATDGRSSVDRPATTAVQTATYPDCNGTSVTNKVYADGAGPSYTYSPEGRLARRAWARGVTTDYAYDALGQMTNINSIM